jgi:hypothetical protein
MKAIIAALLLCSSISSLAAPEPCPDNPYAIKTGNTGVSIIATLPPMLAGGVAKPGSNTVQAAAEFSRSMYAAMGPSVVREVLDVYTCVVEQAIDADATKTPEQKAVIKDAWQTGVADILGTTAHYFGTFLTNVAAVPSINPVNLVQPLDADARSPAPYLNVIKNENFLIAEGYKIWVNATIKGITATACGNYIRAALAVNAGNIQHLAAAVRPVVLAYFADRKTAVRNAKAMLFAEAPTVLMAVVPSDTAAKSSLSQCSTL